MTLPAESRELGATFLYPSPSLFAFHKIGISSLGWAVPSIQKKAPMLWKSVTPISSFSYPTNNPWNQGKLLLSEFSLIVRKMDQKGPLIHGVALVK